MKAEGGGSVYFYGAWNIGWLEEGTDWAPALARGGIPIG